jgi:hypothetical protein
MLTGPKCEACGMPSKDRLCPSCFDIYRVRSRDVLRFAVWIVLGFVGLLVVYALVVGS